MNVIVYGPQGCGKTRNANTLALEFGCAVIVDIDLQGKRDTRDREYPPVDWKFVRSVSRPIWTLTFNTLYLTHSERLLDDIHAIGDARVISFDEAMRLIDQRAQIPDFLRRRAGSFGGAE